MRNSHINQFILMTDWNESFGNAEMQFPNNTVVQADLHNTSDGRTWFVMTSPNPKVVEENLRLENIRRKSDGGESFLYFIPYQFLERRIADDNAFDDTDIDDPHSNASTRDNNSLRAAIRRYIFIKSTYKELNSLLTSDDTKDTFKELWWLRDRSNRHVKVPTSEMEQFINACCDMHIKFEICPAMPSLKKNNEVKLKIGSFKGHKAWILDIKHRSDGTAEFTVGFHLFADTAMIRLRRLSSDDVIVKPDKSQSSREHNNYRLLEDIQRKVFLLLSHRMAPFNLTDATLRKDSATLEKLNCYRYRSFESFSLRAKHCALMLLCTLLCADIYARRQFTAKAIALIEEAEARPVDKSPRDIMAYLHSVLYMATADLTHYKKAKQYFISLNRLTSTHRMLIGFMDDEELLKW